MTFQCKYSNNSWTIQRLEEFFELQTNKTGRKFTPLCLYLLVLTLSDSW